MSNQVQAMTIAMFGAAAGGYTAELEASVEASGVAAVANGIMGLQQPLLGVDLSDNAVWTDLVLANLGISDTNAAYGTAAAYFAARFEAGATRGDIVAEAVAYLTGTVSAEFTAVAAAFVAQVEVAEEWSLADGAEAFSIGALREGAGNTAAPSAFNLTAALGTLTAAEEALNDFLTALDLDGNGKADNATAEDPAAANDADLDDALATAESDLGDLVDAANGVIVGEDDPVYADVATSAAQQEALLIKAQGALNLALANANADLTAANAEIAAYDKANPDADLTEAIAAYEAAVAAEKATTAADDKAWAAYNASETNFEVDNAATINWTWDGDALTYTVTATIDGETVDLFVIDESGKTFTVELLVAEADYAGVTDLANKSLAGEVTYAADVKAEAKLTTATSDLTAADDNSLYAPLLDAKTAVKDAQADVDALAKAVADFEEVAAVDDQRTALEDAVAEAGADIGAAGYDLNAAGYDANGDTDYTDAGDLAIGADDDEMEVYTVDGSAGDTIELGAGDSLFIGGYTYNAGKLDTAGNNSVLEFFITEEAGGGLTLSFETSEFGSNTTTPEVVEVTLTGVFLDDVVIGSNFITLA